MINNLSIPSPCNILAMPTCVGAKPLQQMKTSFNALLAFFMFFVASDDVSKLPKPGTANTIAERLPGYELECITVDESKIGCGYSPQSNTLAEGFYKPPYSGHNTDFEIFSCNMAPSYPYDSSTIFQISCPQANLPTDEFVKFVICFAANRYRVDAFLPKPSEPYSWATDKFFSCTDHVASKQLAILGYTGELCEGSDTTKNNIKDIVPVFAAPLKTTLLSRNWNNLHFEFINHTEPLSSYVWWLETDSNQPVKLSTATPVPTEVKSKTRFVIDVPKALLPKAHYRIRLVIQGKLLSGKPDTEKNFITILNPVYP